MGSEQTADERGAPGSLSTRVCLALAEDDDVNLQESPPLYEFVDPSVLEALDEQDNEAWRLAFEAGTHTVVVTGDGEVTVDGVRFSDRDYRAALDSLDYETCGRQKLIR